MGHRGGEAAGCRRPLGSGRKRSLSRERPGLSGRVLGAGSPYMLRQKGGCVPRVQFSNWRYLHSATDPATRLQPSPEGIQSKATKAHSCGTGCTSNALLLVQGVTSRGMSARVPRTPGNSLLSIRSPETICARGREGKPPDHPHLRWTRLDLPHGHASECLVVLESSQKGIAIVGVCEVLDGTW